MPPRFVPVDAKQASSSVAPTLTLEEVQAEIGSEDTALLEYALGDEKSYVWVVDPHQITVARTAEVSAESGNRLMLFERRSSLHS